MTQLGIFRRTPFPAALIALLAMLTTGCATSGGGLVETGPSPSERPDPRAREAIMAMAGDYDVTFDFRETVSFDPGYEPHEPYLSGGKEVVRVIRDEPGVIELQHVLVVGPAEAKQPIKHWRQKWVFEPEYLYEYRGDNHWVRRDLTEAERRGRWAQFVYQVDDSPRYYALGDWQFGGDYASWTGDPAYRPLPRRDATKRDDYDAVLAVNRHALTPRGWVHEQDNTKTRLSDAGEAAPLVREVGVNRYQRDGDFPVEVAEAYWRDTKAYWARVRDLWTELEEGSDEIRLTMTGEPTPLYSELLQAAADYASGDVAMAEALERARTAVKTYVVQSDARLAGNP